MKHLILVLPLLGASCALLEPSDAGTTRIDVPGEEARPVTKADEAIDSGAAVLGTVTGNPVLWGLAASMGHLVVGALKRRKNEPAVG